ncbi:MULTISPECIES: Fe-S biogenesis protein NfuA [unclassified Hahella]|uniref:Fe-S biogenesis protein NfuA n=1 Tax=unclassified Hahella TaxID=2624107 RepID=UPI001C1EDEE0|nr:MULTISPECIES: Fe-S biogenesis protein NfuA [unclassified Hahella]MBU6950903.1 Fe-S biogenesis protein NfuA [Hahella sp. HN01]MDG9671878.1 Fe-S biogenesis protein NfuA [Hahella sp. CR1]
MVTVTESARDYLAQLLEKQKTEGMGVRMFVTQPGTKYAETCLAYCKPEEIIKDDEKVEFDAFTLYLDKNSLPYLEEAFVDFNTERMGGQLTIKAPNAKMPKVDESSPLPDRINYILFTEINPGLASHGGEVSLVEVVDDIAVLKFGGGCQGCSAVDFTLKQGVEKTLLSKIPELKGVRDSTDHTVTDNAYYS